MFKALMNVQWKWSRALALLGAVLGFAIPILSVQSATTTYADPRYDARAMISTMESFGMAYALLAVGSGLAFAVLAWSADHRGRHVYALSLPVARWRYAAMRFGAGGIFLLIPTAGVLLGSLVAVLIAPIPEGLHAYPIALALRFLFASGVAFSIFFAISAATAQTAAIVLGTIVVVLAAMIFTTAAAHFGLADRLAVLLFLEPGLLSVFTGRWSLIDV